VSDGAFAARSSRPAPFIWVLAILVVLMSLHFQPMLLLKRSLRNMEQAIVKQGAAQAALLTSRILNHILMEWKSLPRRDKDYPRVPGGKG